MDSFNVIVTWYALTTLVSLAFTPFAILIFRHLTDRGASFGRILSVLVLAWPAWFLSSFMSGIVPFGLVTLWSTIALGGIAAWALAIRAKVIDREILVHIAVAEAGYLAMFAAYVWFRGYDPTIMLQEKFSDLMMLSSTMRTDQMPPNDAWLAGETINYYYVGYVPWAAIGKLAGTTPAFAYNLALASVFASTVTAAIGMVANVIGRYQSLLAARIAGGLAALFLVFMATPWAAFTAIDERDSVWDQFWFDFMWPATRQLVGGTAENSPEAITEFPAFSFQLGDLHPHLLALPFTLLALGLAWMLATLPAGQGLRTQWWRVAVAGGVVGGLYAMNSWDFPAYLLLAIGGLVAGSSTWATRGRIGGAALLIASSIVAWIPFYVHFEAPTAPADTPFADAVQDVPVVGGILASLAAWDGPATTLGQYTGLFGFAWIVAIALISWELWARRDLPADPLVTKLTLGVAGVLALIGLLLPMPLLVLAGIPTVLIFLLWQRDSSISAANVALTLFALGFLLTLVPEFLYLIDIFNNRMNTVFKLYYQAWVMFALGAAIGLVVLWQAVRSLPVARVALATATAVIVIGGVGAAAVGAHQWNSWRLPPDSGWIGMDGLHFLETDPGWAGQNEAVDWLYDNARENDVMLSVGGCEWANDVGLTASASGVPAILGWDTHERQWHLGQPGFYDETVQRTADIETLWQTLDPALLDRYGVTLVYIGPLETNGPIVSQEEGGATCAPGPFANASNPEFPGSGWSEVYTNDDGVRIYRRDDG